MSRSAAHRPTWTSSGRHRCAAGIFLLDLGSAATVGALSELTRGEDEAGAPAGRATVRRRAGPCHLVAAAGQQPSHEGVGVPHLAGTQFVAAPREGRYARHEVKQVPGPLRVLAEDLGAVDGIRHVRYGARTPTADLVPEELRVAQPAGPDRAFLHDAAVGGLGSPHRAHLDHEAVAADLHLQSGVVEVLNGPMIVTGRQGLEQATVRSYEVTAGAQRQPVQQHARWLEASSRACGHCSLTPTPS